MRLAICRIAAVAVCLLSHRALGQAAPATPTAVGVWRGTSRCMVRPSSCNDEVAVYRISRAAAGDSLSLDGRRVVNGREVEMGVLTCAFSVSSGKIGCTIPSGRWTFTVRGDSLVGELRSPDNTKLRDVRTARDRP